MVRIFLKLFPTKTTACVWLCLHNVCSLLQEHLCHWQREIDASHICCFLFSFSLTQTLHNLLVFFSFFFLASEIINPKKKEEEKKEIIIIRIIIWSVNEPKKIEILLAAPSQTMILPSRSMQTPAGVWKLPSFNGFDVVAILVKHLNAIVVDQDVVIRINKEMLGILDWPSTCIEYHHYSTHNTNKFALKIKDLQPMAFKLTHHNISIRQKTNSHGTHDLTMSLSKRPKLPQKLPLRVENLNAIVAIISHDIISLLINNNNATCAIELTITLTTDPNTRRKVPFSSKIWMRSLLVSATTIWLFLWSTVTPWVSSNRPFPFPFEPNLNKNLPFRSNTWMRWLE